MEKTEHILKIWNSNKPVRLIRRFSMAPFRDVVCTIWLHWIVLWYNFKNASLELLFNLIDSLHRVAKEPSLKLDDYIHDNRARHWKNAFIEKIKAK